MNENVGISEQWSKLGQGASTNCEKVGPTQRWAIGFRLNAMAIKMSNSDFQCYHRKETFRCLWKLGHGTGTPCLDTKSDSS